VAKSKWMINIDIAFDGADADLGNYFEESKTDLISFISAIRNDHAINEISTMRCNQAYIDLRLPMINGSNYLFVCYSHGLDDSLVANGTFFIKKDVNCNLFINSFFYSMSCLTARQLSGSMLGHGCHAFIGYSEKAGALLGPFQNVSIDCDNYGIKRFFEGHTIGDSFALMKQNFDVQIDALTNAGEPLLAAELRANRDSLQLNGDSSLRIQHFELP